jgi:hypothetical protein
MTDTKPYMNHGQRVPLPQSSDAGKIVEKKTWTRREIDEMSSAEYSKNLSNPAFVQAIDGVPETPKT